MKKTEKVVIKEKPKYTYGILSFEQATNMFLNKEVIRNELLCISVDDYEIWDFDDVTMSDFRDKEMFFVKRTVVED